MVADWGELRKNLPEKRAQLLDLADFSPQATISGNKLVMSGPF